MTIDEKTVVTHKESNPFAINYYGFGSTTSLGVNVYEARFYYNCNPVSIFINYLFYSCSIKTLNARAFALIIELYF